MSTVFIDCLFSQPTRPASFATLIVDAARPHGSIDGAEAAKDADGLCIDQSFSRCIRCEAVRKLREIGVHL